MNTAFGEIVTSDVTFGASQDKPPSYPPANGMLSRMSNVELVDSQFPLTSMREGA